MPRKPTREQAIRAVRVLLQHIGEDVTRPGLRGTPERVVRAWEQDWGAGYREEFVADQEASIRRGLFKNEGLRYSQMILVNDLTFYSHCEHHLALFVGKVHVAYIPPNGAILGLSKVARIVDMVTRRLQVQERITLEVADRMQKATGSKHVGVVVSAVHHCMCSRGVRQPESSTTTSELRGDFYDDARTRAEFMQLVGR